MTSLIPNEIIDSILDKVDIVEVLSSRLPLKKSGSNFKANCPFHNEKTPSFMISPAKQIFHCFGCGEGGNAIGFLMKYEKLTFREALQILADKAGIKLPAAASGDRQADSLSEKLYSLNEKAKDFYKEILHKENGNFCRRYLKERGISEETIKTFQLGLAPDSWDGLIAFFRNKNIKEELLQKAGLAVPSQKGQGFYDRFHSRLMFPIFNARGKVVGFGARTLGDTMPKYLNSPETPLYTKAKHLYGLNLSGKYIREKDFAVIVEGYFDYLAPFQYGIKNIVATLGTALTTDHIRLLKRFTKTVVMVFDADAAGEEASLRGLDLLISQDMNVRVAALPKGFDPDSFVRKYGKEAFENIIKASKDLFDYKMNLLMKKFNKDGVRGKTAIATLMLPTIARIPNEILKEAFLKKLSDMLAISETALRAELKKTKIDYSQPVAETIVAAKKNQVKHAELLLLSIILEEPESLNSITEKLALNEFKNLNVKKIIEFIGNLLKGGKKIIPGKIINYFDDEETKNIISGAVAVRETIVDKEKVFQDCVNRIKEDNFKDSVKNLENEIRLAHDLSDEKKVDDLLIKYNELIKTYRK